MHQPLVTLALHLLGRVGNSRAKVRILTPRRFSMPKDMAKSKVFTSSMSRSGAYSRTLKTKRSYSPPFPVGVGEGVVTNDWCIMYLYLEIFFFLLKSSNDSSKCFNWQKKLRMLNFHMLVIISVYVIALLIVLAIDLMCLQHNSR